MTEQKTSGMMNRKIYSLLSKLSEHYEGDKYRSRAIKNASLLIGNLNYEIRNAKELSGLPGIGEGMIRRVEEILRTGNLEELKDFQEQFDFSNIPGIGKVTAEELKKKGVKNVDHLRILYENGEMHLNEIQIFGIENYGKFKEKIPREEIKILSNNIKLIAMKINSDIFFETVGSYRRGKSESGDIDILISKVNILEELIENLVNENIIVKVIAKGPVKFMGFHENDEGMLYNVDIRYVPEKSLATALLHSTGPFSLNIEMRSYAKEMSYKLSEYSLTKDDKVIPVSTEMDVFSILGLKYIPPNER